MRRKPPAAPSPPRARRAPPPLPLPLWHLPLRQTLNEPVSTSDALARYKLCFAQVIRKVLTLYNWLLGFEQVWGWVALTSLAFVCLSFWSVNLFVEVPIRPSSNPSAPSLFRVSVTEKRARRNSLPESIQAQGEKSMVILKFSVGVHSICFG